MPSQCYATSVGHDSQALGVEIWSFPRPYLAANRLLSPLHVARSLGRDQIGVRGPLGSFATQNGNTNDALASLVYLLIAAPEVFNEPQFLDSMPSAPDEEGANELRPPPKWSFPLELVGREGDLPEFSRYVATARIVPIEASPLSPKTLGQVAGTGGGLGLGVLVATGALPPLALITVPAGIIAFGAGWSLRRKIERFIDRPEDEIGKWKALLDAGKITQEHYDEAVRNIIGQATRPTPSTA